MAKIVLATEMVFAKAEATFRSAQMFEVQPVSCQEQTLADAVLAQNSRAVIVGTDPYCGPMYEALGRTGGDAGTIIARFGVGHDSIDKTLARKNNIVVTNTPGALDISVAEHTIWLMGNLARHISSSESRFRAGGFQSPAGIEIGGKTIGVVGFGAIGRRVAAMAHSGFGMRVLAADCRTTEELEKQEGKSFEQIKAAFGLDLYTNDADAIFRQADVVSIHLPVNDQTRNFVNAERLGLLKPDAILINTARGAVLDENALYDALAAGRFAGAALDVFQTEPYEPASPEKDLRTLENVVLTPHTGSNTRESNQCMGEACLENISKFFAGQLDELTRV